MSALRRPPHDAILWRFWRPDGKGCRVTAQTYFDARMRAAVLLKEDPMRLRGAQA